MAEKNQIFTQKLALMELIFFVQNLDFKFFRNFEHFPKILHFFQNFSRFFLNFTIFIQNFDHFFSSKF